MSGTGKSSAGTSGAGRPSAGGSGAVESGAGKPGAGVAARLRAFGAFWYDFVVGDDWRVAIGVVIALAATWGLSRASVPAWWLVPVAALALLSVSLWTAVRRR